MAQSFKLRELSEFRGDLRHEQRDMHPIEKIQQMGHLEVEENKLRSIEALFGQAAARKRVFEAEFTSGFARRGDRNPSNLLLEVLTNKINRMDYNDYMGVDGPQVDVLGYAHSL